MADAWHSPVWPSTEDELVREQERLAGERPAPWRLQDAVSVAGCFVCFPRGQSGPGGPGDHAWSAAALGRELVVVEGKAGAAYRAGLLALREGLLLEAAVRALPESPDALLVDATGRDHPRRAGLAFQLGAVLGTPTVGVTHRPLCAEGSWPAADRGAVSPLRLDGELVGYWLRTRTGRRPLAVHAAWRTDAATAVAVVLACCGRTRTPAPLRAARTAARTARAHAR
jgi:deoxyribonuclease V